MEYHEWFFLSLASSIAYAISSNLVFYIGKQPGGFNMTALNCVVYAFLGFVIAPALALVEAKKDADWMPPILKRAATTGPLKNYIHDVKRGFTNPKMLKYVVMTAATTVIANICLYSSYATAPNPGMCDAVSSSASFVSLLLSAALLGSAVHENAVFGMVLMAAAGYLLV